MTALPAGFAIGRYRFERELGSGGFGITYLAWDETLGTKLAIKEYAPQDCARREKDGIRVSAKPGGEEHFSSGMARFLAEARILARLDGAPGIVGVRDYFEANGTAYLVMRYIEGTTLREHIRLRGGKLPWAEALALLLPAMEALREVHAGGVLHRDVSPDNIMVTPEGQVRLLDFGAARPLTGATMSVILKPGYAPEEQYRSRGEQGPWTDVYAVAATLWRCVTGQVPPESLDRLAGDTLQPPSRFGIAIPPHAEAALMRGLAIRAGDRHKDMAEFIAGLTGTEPTEPITLDVSPPKHAHNPRESVPRRRADAPRAANKPKDPRPAKNARNAKNSPVRSAVTLGLAFALVIGAVGGIGLLFRSIQNPFGGLAVTASPTPSPTPASSEGTPLPSESLPEKPTPTPEGTPEPPPEVSVRGAADYAPVGGRQWLTRYADGDLMLTATRLIEDKYLARLDSATDDTGTPLGGRALTYLVARADGLYEVDGSDLSRSMLVLPVNPKVGDTWAEGGTTVEIVAVNLEIMGRRDVILTLRRMPAGDVLTALAPGRGAFAAWNAASPEEIGDANLIYADEREESISQAAYEAIAALSLNYEAVR